MSNNITEFVDIDMLEVWKVKLSDINTSCLSYLDDFEKLALELNGVWSGNAATGFDAEFNKELKTAREHHTELKDVHQFLATIAETVIDQ